MKKWLLFLLIKEECGGGIKGCLVEFYNVASKQLWINSEFVR